jgi:hypothetical protein
MALVSYARHQFPLLVIQHVVWLYLASRRQRGQAEPPSFRESDIRGARASP